MKKLKTLLQHNIIYYVFLFILIAIYLMNNNVNNYTSAYKTFDNEIFTITNIEKKDYGLKLSLKGKEKVLAYLYNNKNKYEIGDEIKISGDINDISNNTVPNTFNYKKYLISNNIHNVIIITKIKKVSSNRNLLYKIKTKLIERGNKLSKSYPYINSLLFGNNKYIEEETISSYQNNGISHLFAISGLHISMFILILSFILKKFNKYIKYTVIIIFLIFYMFLTNFSMSVIRGAIFTILIIINKIFNLKISNKNLLITTLIIIMASNPLYINNVGLLYSFIVTFSLITFSNLIKGSKIKTLLLTSLIAFLVSYPITINNFNEVNFLSVIYNIFFVPYVSVILLPLVLISYIFPPLDSVLYFFINIIEKASLFLINIKLGKLSMQRMSYCLILIYYIIVFVTLKKISKKKYKMLIILSLFFLVHYLMPIKNNNNIIFFDVGQGDSSLISINKNHTIIDTGGKVKYDTKKDKYSIVKNKTIPYLKSVGIKKINNLVITHGDYDHMGETINLVENFKVEKVIFNCGPYNKLEQKLIKVLDKKNIKYSSCIKELNIDKYKLKFLNTKEYDNENDNSNVTYLNYNGIKMLFMGDAGTEKEQDILEKYNLKDIDFIKVGHHGSDTSSNEDFVNKINPKYSLISVGKNNRYGHPKDEVLEILSKSKIYRTDLDGSIEIKLNKNGYKIRTCTP